MTILFLPFLNCPHHEGMDPVILIIVVPDYYVSGSWHSAWCLEAFNKHLLDVEWNDDHYHFVQNSY